MSLTWTFGGISNRTDVYPRNYEEMMLSGGVAVFESDVVFVL